MSHKKEDVIKLAKSILEEVQRDPKAADAIAKSANPDAKADEQLGEKVEHDVIDHLKENKTAEAQEGHDLKSLVMEKWEPRYYKKSDNMSKSHIGFDKMKNKLAHKPGIKDPAAVAAVIGRKKYGAKGMAAKAAAGKKSEIYKGGAGMGEDITSPSMPGGTGAIAGGSSMSTGIRMSEDVKKSVMEKWEPRYYKCMKDEGYMALPEHKYDAGSVQKGEKGKDAPAPVFADKFIKPKDVKESGVSDMAILKLKSPKGNN
jgi:hypothetical protein